MIKRKKRFQPEEEFQMAPMIDMVFLLLVFFMCVSTLAKADKAQEVELPESHASEVPEDVSARGVVSVKEDGTIFLGTQAVSLEALKDRIGGEIKKNPVLKITVRADRTTPFAEIKKVLKACAEVGAYEVIYATYEARS